MMMEKLKKYLPEALSIRQWLMISAIFSIGILSYRILKTGHLTYTFLVWNLFLAWIPYHISEWLAKNPRTVKNRFKLGLIISGWLLFMPNSFYILTDLFHLENIDNKHQWRDLTVILSFAWTGILLGIISIRRMESILTASKGKLISSVVICVVMWLNAFGIYLGRFLRFNSWDILTHPLSLFREIFDLFSNPFDHRGVWSMTIAFSFFMIIVYYTVKKLSEAVR
jgi:uncharacterized membrane protein